MRNIINEKFAVYFVINRKEWSQEISEQGGALFFAGGVGTSLGHYTRLPMGSWKKQRMCGRMGVGFNPLSKDQNNIVCAQGAAGWGGGSSFII